jgi:hypothetical protein
VVRFYITWSMSRIQHPRQIMYNMMHLMAAAEIGTHGSGILRVLHGDVACDNFFSVETNGILLLTPFCQ